MSSLRRRLVFDLMLSIVLVFEMLYQVTGNTLHEIVGAAFFACIVVHILFSRNWIAKTAGALKDGSLAKKQVRLAVVAALLAVDVLLLAVSSAVISQKLWDAGINLSMLNPGNVFYPIHTVCAYGMCILVLAHLVMHWASVADALAVRYDPSRREAIASAFNGIAMVGGIALGIGGLMRAGMQASDFVVAEDDSQNTATVTSGYREVNAQTGEYVTKNSFEAASLSEAESSAASSSAQEEDSRPTVCPICPRQCKLTAPRCERPYEAGLI